MLLLLVSMAGQRGRAFEAHSAIPAVTCRLGTCNALFFLRWLAVVCCFFSGLFHIALRSSSARVYPRPCIDRHRSNFTKRILLFCANLHILFRLVVRLPLSDLPSNLVWRIVTPSDEKN